MSSTGATSTRRVLVTGVAGRIGTATAKLLTDLGVSVTGLSLTTPAHRYCDRYICGDAASPQVVRDALADVDAVVHLAALAHPTLGTPFDVYHTNVVSTFNVFCAAGENGISRIVAASSINANGIPFNAHRVMPAYFPIDEELPSDIEDAYSLSKATGELAAHMTYRRWGTTVVSLRFPLTQSHDDLRTSMMRVTANPGSVVREGWSYLDVRDAARAIWLGLTRPIIGAHVFLLSAVDTLIASPTEHLLHEWAPDVPLRRPLIGQESAVSNRLIHEKLGFLPVYSVHTGGF